MVSFFYKLFSAEIAIDLGTANTLIYERNKGVILNEPSIVSILEKDGQKKIIAVGREAQRMIGRTPSNVRTSRPLKDGVIADFEAAEEMIKHFIMKVFKKRLIIRPLIAICVPSGATPVERRAIKEAAESCGARQVFLIEEPMAAALGCSLPVDHPTGSMICDIGGGTTEVAVLCMKSVIYSTSLRVAGDRMNEAILKYIRRTHGVIIGEHTAQQIKETIGTCIIPENGVGLKMLVRGRNIKTGVPYEVIVTEKQMYEALRDPIERIIEACCEVLEHTPPELAEDILARGIVLTGGGSLLKGIDVALSKALNIPVSLNDTPLLSIALGTGLALENFEYYRAVLTKSVTSSGY